MGHAYHYVYSLTRTTRGNGPRYYIGVRTCYGRIPQYDYEYQGSSGPIRQARLQGHVFKKDILAEFPTRRAAEGWEIYLHEYYEVDTNPEFYNIITAKHEERIKARETVARRHCPNCGKFLTKRSTN